MQIMLVGATYVSHLGHNAGGATRWLRLGPLVFQPSELAKITVTILVAHLLAKQKEAKMPLQRWFLLLSPIAILLALIFKQPDLGTTVLITVTIVGISFIAGMKLVYLFGLLGTGAAAFTFSLLHSEYRRRRLFAFLNPWNDPQGNGFQTIQSFLSFHSGRFFGTGIGNGNSKLFYLPEVHTDFVYALIGEELGFVGAIALLAAFVYFSYLLFKVSLHAKDSFGCYLGFGLALSLVLQIAVNLGGVTGILPVKGLPLPFISWGRSALIVNLAMMGILLNIVRQSTIIPSKKSK
jgi:cell division protein FtsW